MYVEFFELVPGALLVVAGLFGLLVGSFVNVVAYRLPIMMERDWRRQCEELDSEPSTLPVHARETRFDLWYPRSACPECGAQIAARDNIPVLSYLLLGGRCRYCGSGISVRYPIIEAAAALIAVVVAWVFGPSWQMLAAIGVSWTLLALSIIDIDRFVLPDALTIPLMWCGIVVSAVWTGDAPLFVGLRSSVLGAVTGYLSLWSVYQLFKLATGKEGMGYGDFKLLAALGAWLGWEMLPLVILMSTAVGALIGGAQLAVGRRSSQTPIPFGPYLAAAGWIALLWGERLNSWYLDTFF